MKPFIRVRLIVRWYDFYIGLYYDRKERALYWLIVPMIGLRFQLVRDEISIDLPGVWELRPARPSGDQAYSTDRSNGDPTR